AAAEPFRGTLLQKGYAKEMLIVRRPSEQPFERIQKIVDDEGDQYTIASASLLVLPVTAEAIEIAKLPYRGGARVFINSRGLFNVINELNLEDYLRGVVPNELGPRIYDELEAQKAQTLAARTYAVGRLGEYAPEGYDICPTPACQVYRGYSTEEKLSDQAIAETAGLIITHEGKPIDALYTSTCGGETSDVGVMFPGRTDPYLRRARCVEMEMVTIAGRADSGILNEVQGDARLFAALAKVPERADHWSANALVNLVSKAASLAGMTLDPALAPRSIRRGDALAYIGEAFELVEGANVVLLPEDRAYYFPQSELQTPLALAASFLIKYKIAPTQHLDRVDDSSPMPRDEVMALLYSWLRRSEAIREATGKIAAVNGREVVLKAEGMRKSYRLPAQIPLLRRMGERLQEYSSLPIMIGDRASILLERGGAPAAMVVQANYDGASFDRTSSYANWVRSYRADELVSSIGRRNPIQKLLGIRPLVVDLSHRIAEMEITAEDGRTFVLRGLPVRWSLNVPDNLFVSMKSSDPDGMDRYTFFGKGWGHGVGLCQVGAYGMAFRGWTAEQIIKRFYSGVEIVKWGGK
ncbi:MAG TPA: SpoIID/LytB domain-containing protein, partial [Thermoanaerobaculia bacterium]